VYLKNIFLSNFKTDISLSGCGKELKQQNEVVVDGTLSLERRRVVVSWSMGHLDGPNLVAWIILKSGFVRISQSNKEKFYFEVLINNNINTKGIFLDDANTNER
jgi:hypothetical protein